MLCYRAECSRYLILLLLFNPGMNRNVVVVRGGISKRICENCNLRPHDNRFSPFYVENELIAASIKRSSISQVSTYYAMLHCPKLLTTVHAQVLQFGVRTCEHCLTSTPDPSKKKPLKNIPSNGKFISKSTVHL